MLRRCGKNSAQILFAHHDEPNEENKPFDEKAKIKGAIRTDFILSAEIIIIALGELSDAEILTQIISLIIIGLGITLVVYGIVALIVKADDFGVFLIKKAVQPKR